MRILITNDDGIEGEGLRHLVNWARRLGEVVVAAPKVEQSAKSHTIEIHKSFEAKKVEYLPGVTAYAVDSSPADCVRLLVLGLEEHFDLVLSGINRGLNVGCDIIYSGTVGAIFEALFLCASVIPVLFFIPSARIPLLQISPINAEIRMVSTAAAKSILMEANPPQPGISSIRARNLANTR